jgi:DNA mismatch repair ATPase MutS
MKQIALIIILAQIGCFVPCDFFMFSLRNFIYTRFDTNDSIIENKGAFVKQIIDIQKVILNKTNNSLILLDEPFENTSSYDVLSIAISFLDMLTMLFNDSFIIISSHNKILTQLSEFYLNAITGSMVVEFKENGIDFLFKFKYVCGNNSNHNEKDEMEKNYGVVLAEMIGYNKEMIEFCKGIGEDICGKEGKVEDCIVLSKEGNMLKVFLMKMFMDVFDIMFCKRNYVLEEELNSKICKLFIFVNSCLKN